MTTDEVLKVLDEFNVRFYRWSLADARREASEDYPLIRAVKGSAALGTVDYFETLTANDRLSLGVALVKRVNESALKITSEPLTEYESALIKDFLGSAGRFFQKRSYEYTLQRSGVSGKKNQAVNKRELERLVKERLKPLCGDVYSKDSGGEWVHRTSCGNWIIDTQIDTVGSAFQLTYEHEIVSPRNQLKRLKQVISLLNWLGIFRTEWDMLFDIDVEEAVEVLARCCSHFMQAAPALLVDLEP